MLVLGGCYTNKYLLCKDVQMFCAVIKLLSRFSEGVSASVHSRALMMLVFQVWALFFPWHECITRSKFGLGTNNQTFVSLTPGSWTFHNCGRLRPVTTEKAVDILSSADEPSPSWPTWHDSSWKSMRSQTGTSSICPQDGSKCIHPVQSHKDSFIQNIYIHIYIQAN